MKVTYPVLQNEGHVTDPIQCRGGGGGGALPYKHIRDVPFFTISIFNLNS